MKALKRLKASGAVVESAHNKNNDDDNNNDNDDEDADGKAKSNGASAVQINVPKLILWQEYGKEN